MIQDFETNAMKKLLQLEKSDLVMLSDIDLKVLRSACTALLNLDKDAKQRVLEYVNSRLGAE